MKSRTHRQDGVAALEFALLVGVITLIAFGTTELGRAFYQYNTLLKSTRAAAREMSFGSAANHMAAARCLAVHGNRTCEGDTLLVDLTADLVKFPPSDPGCVLIQGFNFVSYVPFVIPDIAFSALRTCMPPGPS